jgi:glycine oxidase
MQATAAGVTGPHARDVAIIGNGSLGATLARILKGMDPTLAIAVIGLPGRPGAASTTAGAMLNCWAEIGPGALEDQYLSQRFELIRSALGLWEEWGAELSDETSLPVDIRWGTDVINAAGGPPAEDVAFEYMQDAMTAAGVAHGDATTEARRILDPDPGRRPIRAERVPDGCVDSRQVMAALDESLRLRGVEAIPARAIGVTASTPGGSVHLDDGTTVQAGVIVVANGSFARELEYHDCDLGQTVLPLFYGGGSALQLRLPSWAEPPAELKEMDIVLRTMDRGGACGYHLVPLGCPDFYFGASSGVWDTPEDAHRAHALAFLLDGVGHEFHKAFFHAGVTLRGPGFRPVSLDALPLIGPTNAEGIWYLNGMKRDGFTSAPYTARELAKAILGEPNALPADFAPQRKPITYLTREKAIDAAVTATIGGELMHGLQLPPYRREEWAAHTREKLNSIYDARELGEFGVHPELLHFYEYDTYWDENVRRFVES